MNGQEIPTVHHGALMQTIRHELRTPVNHIIGFSEMLLEEAADLSLPADYDVLQHVVVAGRQILMAISEILAGSDIVVRESDLVALHSRIAPALSQITQVCSDLVILAEREERGQFAADLRKIKAAAAQLDLLSSGALASAEPPRMVSAPPPADPPPAELSGHLLLVDDNDMNRDMLSRRLERLGYQVTQAADGRPALDAMRAIPFALVLLDIMMPGMDGYAVLREMKADLELSRIPEIGRA
ncbi:MAG: response regulator, partial [Oscillochloris sp.]|nr:response regulator [Oscillochloris sp.]